MDIENAQFCWQFFFEFLACVNLCDMYIHMCSYCTETCTSILGAIFVLFVSVTVRPFSIESANFIHRCTFVICINICSYGTVTCIFNFLSIFVWFYLLLISAANLPFIIEISNLDTDVSILTPKFLFCSLTECQIVTTFMSITPVIFVLETWNLIKMWICVFTYSHLWQWRFQ